MEVEQHDCGTAVAPDDLETVGLGPCIGVAIIHKNRGFLLHSPDVITEKDGPVARFFSLLDRYIPQSERGGIKPVLAGGEAAGKFHKDILECRYEISRWLMKAGFAMPRKRWAVANEAHSLYLDLAEQKVELKIWDTDEDEETLNIYQF